jgi:hypothetical protein
MKKFLKTGDFVSEQKLSKNEYELMAELLKVSLNRKSL